MARWALSVGAVAVALSLSACGGGDGDEAESPARPDFVQADVDFVVHLSAHHNQALGIAELAARKATDPDLKRMARDVVATYSPQVDEISGLLNTWAAGGAEMPAHSDFGGETGPGMLPAKEVARVERLSKKAYDTALRKLMVRHHEGLLDLVDDHVTEGRSPAAGALARDARELAERQLAALEPS